MDKGLASQAAAIMHHQLQEGTVLQNLPDSLRPHSRADGYEIQAMLEKQKGNDKKGWKIAATSIAGQQHIGLSGPIAGRIFSGMIVEPGTTVPFGANRMRVAEAEFVFCFGRELPPRTKNYSSEEVSEAVASLHLGLEFPDSRFADFASAGEAQLIADNACAYKFMMGTAVTYNWREMDLSAHQTSAIVTRKKGEPAPIHEKTDYYEGVGANVLGCPRMALTWLVNELSLLNITLKKGEFVTTGTTTTPMAILPGDKIEADFGTLGKICSHLSKI